MTTAAAPARTRTSTTTEYAAVLQAVRALGLLERRRPYYLVKLAVLLTALAAVWVGFALLDHAWSQLAISAALAIVLVQIIFLSHDAAHRQMFTSGKANDRVAMVLGTGVAGISLSWWNAKHAKHHAAPNQIDRDPDITPSIVHFYPVRTPIRSRVARFLHEHQGWWFFPILVVESLNLQVQSVQYLFAEARQGRKRAEFVLLVLRLAALPALLFTLLPVGLAVLFLVVNSAVTGVYLGISFAVSHVGMPIVPPTEKMSFLERQLRTSRNVLGGRWITGAMGGLNFQIEHHLFPSMPRPNLRKAAPVVQSHCARLGIPYHEVPVHRAWAIVVRYLNAVGLAGRNAYGCPTASVLR